jgi:uncharacterized protein (DUF934 family)
MNAPMMIMAKASLMKNRSGWLGLIRKVKLIKATPMMMRLAPKSFALKYG